MSLFTFTPRIPFSVSRFSGYSKVTRAQRVLALIAPVVTLIAFALLDISPVHAQEVLDGLAAVVNSEPITFSQVRELVSAKEKAASEQLSGKELQEKIKQIRVEAIDELVDRQLILQYFKEKGFTLPSYLIEDRLNTIIREEHNGDRAAFARKLASFGFTIERFRKEEMNKIIVQSMRQQAVKTATAIPSEKLKAFYKEHISEFTTEEQAQLRMIILRSNDKGTPEQRKQLLEEIRSKVSSGAKFADLARLYSEDSTAESGGDWGWVQNGLLLLWRRLSLALCQGNTRQW